MEQKVTKPMCMELEEAQEKIVCVINDCASRVPFYLLESIVINSARQVSELARKERETAKRQYEQELSERSNQGDERNCNNV